MKRYSSGSNFEDAIGYSRAVSDGNYIHVSGTTGYDYTTMQIQPGVVEQAEQCMKNVAQALAHFGADFSHVVRVHYYFANAQDFEQCWGVFRRCFAESPPAATMTVASLLDPDMKLEVVVTALQPR